MKKTVKLLWDIGDEVILKTEPEIKRQISGVILRPKSVTYLLMKGDEETGHSECEITAIPQSRKVFKVKGFIY